MVVVVRIEQCTWSRAFQIQAYAQVGLKIRVTHESGKIGESASAQETGYS